MALWKWALRHSVEKLVEYAQSSDAQRHLSSFPGALGQAILPPPSEACANPKLA